MKQSIASNSSDSIFIDTSFFKALLDPKDDFSKQAEICWQSLMQKGSHLITSNFILDESYALLRKRCGKKTAFILHEYLFSDWKTLEIIRVTIDDETNAWEWFEKDWSKLSYTDCVSFAVMKRLGLTEVATFDTHFAKAGFKIVKA